MSTVVVADVRFVAASDGELRTGLLGWISMTVASALRLDGIALRRTREGRLTLSFPCRRDASDRQHFYVRPLDREARRSFEQQVFQALALAVEESA